jgi:FdhD protein
LAGNTKKYKIIRINENGKSEVETEVAGESTLTIKINGTVLAILSCSPSELEYLAVGFAQTQGLIKRREDIAGMDTGDSGIINIRTSADIKIPTELKVTSSGGRSSSIIGTGTTVCDSKITVSADRVFNLMEQFDQYSRDFVKTGGIHSAAICNAEKILVFSEDIGRHNAIEKVFGKCLMQDIPVETTLLITSGRVPSDILLKAAKRKVPVLIARNSPTDLGIDLAEKAGITLLGFVRGTSMNIYTHGWRITR